MKFMKFNGTVKRLESSFPKLNVENQLSVARLMKLEAAELVVFSTKRMLK